MSGMFVDALNTPTSEQEPYCTRYFVITTRRHGSCARRSRTTSTECLTRFLEGSSGRLQKVCRAADGDARLEAADTFGLPQAIAGRPLAVAVLPVQAPIGLVDSITVVFLMNASILQRFHALAEDVAKNKLRPFPLMWGFIEGHREMTLT